MANGNAFVPADDPGCVYPSIVTGSVIVGQNVAAAMVWRPVPGIANAMTSAPTLAFASRMAWRKLPAPESLVLTTVNVAALTHTDVNNATATATTRARIISLPLAMAREATKVAACWQDTNRYTCVQCLGSATTTDRAAA